MDSLARPYAVATKLGYKLSIIAWHNHLPLVNGVAPAQLRE
jgi:hypothetical protein